MSLVEHIAARQERKDCLSCRIIGSASLAGVGFYALYSSRAAAKGSLPGKRLVGIIGLGFLGASVVKWMADA